MEQPAKDIAEDITVDNINQATVVTVTPVRSDQSLRTRAAFFSLVAGMSVVSGFAATLIAAKRKDEAMFDKGFIGQGQGMSETGSGLALRALGRGTLYAVGGFSIICLAVWKLTGAKSLDEFSSKIQSTVRTVSPRDDSRPRGRSEFSSVRELVNYILDEDARATAEKQKTNKNDRSS